MAVNNKQEYSNSAERLLEVLTAAKNYSPPSSAPNPTAKDVWIELLGISKQNPDEAVFDLVRHLIAIKDLFAETEQALKHIEGIDEELYIEPLSRLEKAVSPDRMQSIFRTSFQCLNEADMTALKFIAHVVSQHPTYNEARIPADEIKGMLDELNSLYERIVNSELPVELRNTILDLIDEIRRAINEYRIRGVKGLRNTLALGVGTVIMNREIMEETTNDDDLEALTRMLVRLDKAISFASKVTPLLQAAANVLPRFLHS